MSLTHIQTIELGSSQSSIEFTSIPQDYDDLFVVCSFRSTRTGSATDTFIFRLNGDASNQTVVALRGSGSAAETFTNTLPNVGIAPASDSTANTFGSLEAYVSNYTSSVAKSFSLDSVGENNGTTAYQQISAGLYNSTNAITSMTFLLNSGNLATGSMASLYGVTSGGSGTVTTA